MKSGRDWSSDVRNIGKHARANTARDLADVFKVDYPRISRRATHEQFWSMRLGDLLQLVVVDLFRLARDAVISDFVTETREVQRMPVREMAAVREIHSQNLRSEFFCLFGGFCNFDSATFSSASCMNLSFDRYDS